MAVSFTKNLLGKTIVRFDCPKCKTRMRSPLTDAGKSDRCPECGVGLKIPGEDRLRAELAAAKKQEEAKKLKLAELEAQKGSKQAEQKQDPVFIEASASSTSAEASDPVDEIELGGNFSDDDFAETPPPSFLTNSPSAVRPPIPRLNLNPKNSKPWWHDSIRIESVSSSRYPALIAYRNILVLLWWILTIFCFIAAFAYPSFLIYGAMKASSDINSEIEKSIQAHQSPTIQKVLQAADNDESFSAVEARDFEAFMENQFPTFPNPIRVGFNEDSVSPESLDSFATTWRQWSPSELARLNASRVNLLNTTVVPIAVFFCSLILFYLFASIMILVIPECIKLAIDIEQGVRER